MWRIRSGQVCGAAVIGAILVSTGCDRPRPPDVIAPRPVPAAANDTAPGPVQVVPGSTAPRPVQGPPAAPAVSMIKLRAGESFVDPPQDGMIAGGVYEVIGTNPFIWKPTATDTVELAFVFNRETVRAVVGIGGRAPIELGSFEWAAVYGGSFRAIVKPDGRVVLLFQQQGHITGIKDHTGADSGDWIGDPGFRRAWRLRWDADRKVPVVDDDGQWSGMDFQHWPTWTDLPEP